MSEVTGKAFDFGLLRKIMRYIKPYQKIFWFAFLLTVSLSAISTVRPILIKTAIDDYILKGDGPGLTRISLVLFGFLVLEAVFQFLFIFMANYLGQSIIKDIRDKLFKHLVKFRLSFFDKTPIGTLITRNVSDIETIAQIFSDGLLVIFGDLLKIAVMVIAMFVVFDPKLVLISLSVIPILFYATRWFQKNIKVVFQDVRNQVANLNAFVQEHLVGMKIVQLFNREKDEMAKFVEINEKHKKANIRSIWYFSIFLPIIEILSAVSIGLAVWYGGIKAATTQEVTLGDITAIIIFINMLYRPLRQLADRFNTLQMGMVASERVITLLEKEDDLEVEGKDEIFDVKGEIAFENVHFQYKENEPILKDVSFKANAGETLAIVGATGAGKSTIISLLMGFYGYQQGKVTIDGKEITELKLDNLRSHFALVLQDVFLFSDSILNNITLKEKVDFEVLKDAAKRIGIDEFIEKLPGGYSYDVKERGGMLSAGQRQLLSFLRAYITNPEILILDEATSSVDTHTEELIQNAIDVITEGRTSIIIAHRLATIKKADKILVLDKGEVVEEGTHLELLNRGGYYAKLYEMQFKNEEEAA
ncbi:MAG: ABC transporter ATP-binding protein/permease [Schleiferiaceae bacterium]|jgi:ABC-type multidrug transport system fused ATPase/permease subunit|nr:ABC transporter ATP-binding protein/permease [Schleiferiaceae bacterium]